MIGLLSGSNSAKKVKRNPSADPDGFREQGRRKLPITTKQTEASVANSQAAVAPAVVIPPEIKVLSKSARKRRNKKHKRQLNKNKIIQRDVVKSQLTSTVVRDDGEAKAPKS